MSSKCKQALLKIQDLGKPTRQNNKKYKRENTIGISGMQQSTAHGLQDAGQCGNSGALSKRMLQMNII